MIVQVANAADVSHVVAHSRETGLELAVWSGGHSTAGHRVSERGIVLDLAGMRALDVDVDEPTTLGGGIEYLVPKHGLTIDDFLAADIVTADGQLLRVFHPDLFWAIRGGGGNFGVVTRFRYRLH